MIPSVQVWRRLCQAAIAAGFVVVPLLNARGVSLLSGNLLSVDFFGLTFVDPLAFLQTLAGGPPVMGKALGGAALVLLMALALGRVFCGWMCPYGLASELLFALRGKKNNAPARIFSWVSARTRDARFHPFAFRAVVAGAGLLAVPLFLSEPWLNQLSMPGWYTRALQQALFLGGALSYGALLFPAMLLLEGVSGSRFWCRWLCPQSVCLSLMARCFPKGFGVKWTPGRCACSHGSLPCREACSLGLTPRRKGGPPRGECTQCAECVSACAKHGAALRLGL